MPFAVIELVQDLTDKKGVPFYVHAKSEVLDDQAEAIRKVKIAAKDSGLALLVNQDGMRVHVYRNRERLEFNSQDSLVIDMARGEWLRMFGNLAARALSTPSPKPLADFLLALENALSEIKPTLQRVFRVRAAGHTYTSIAEQVPKSIVLVDGERRAYRAVRPEEKFQCVLGVSQDRARQLYNATLEHMYCRLREVLGDIPLELLVRDECKTYGNYNTKNYLKDKSPPPVVYKPNLDQFELP